MFKMAEFIIVFDDFTSETLIRGGADFSYIADLIKEYYLKEEKTIKYLTIWPITK